MQDHNRERKRALVTGGAGFIGSHLVDRLLAEGFHVAVVDDLSTGRRENLDERASLYAMDIVSPELREVFQAERPQVVFHLAAQASVARSMAEPSADLRTNVLGALSLLDQCRLVGGIERFVYSSTGGALYGEPEALPCTEAHPVTPLSVYGASKYAVEKYLHVFSVALGFPYTVLRYGNVYGPRQDPLGEAGVVAIFAKRMLEGREVVVFGDGFQERDYVYVDDVIDANLRALEQAPERCEVYNIGTGVGTSVRTIFQRLAAATGYDREPVYEPPRPGEVYRIYLDADRARRGLGWTPATDLETGIARTVEAIRLQGPR